MNRKCKYSADKKGVGSVYTGKALGLTVLKRSPLLRFLLNEVYYSYGK